MYKVLVKFRSAVLVFLTHHLALPVLKVIRKPQLFPCTRQQLHQMKAGTMGKELITMLDKNKLQLLPYYARHDIKHILLGYDTTGKGEVCLQCFMLGNRHVSFPVLATVLFGVCTMPEHWKCFFNAYQRGRHSASIEDFKWFEILGEPVSALQEKIKKRNTHV